MHRGGEAVGVGAEAIVGHGLKEADRHLPLLGPLARHDGGAEGVLIGLDLVPLLHLVHEIEGRDPLGLLRARVHRAVEGPHVRVEAEPVGHRVQQLHGVVPALGHRGRVDGGVDANDVRLEAARFHHFEQPQGPRELARLGARGDGRAVGLHRRFQPVALHDVHEIERAAPLPCVGARAHHGCEGEDIGLNTHALHLVEVLERLDPLASLLKGADRRGEDHHVHFDVSSR
mmetsp:Transcript_58380/g.132203  ORF Transcript_58380/g.132203 Transcript_58380/m.132203 type:complete len:230 (+) Transcript_58380:912-1601(+)